MSFRGVAAGSFLTLGIESSCDETSAAVIRAAAPPAAQDFRRRPPGGHPEILSNVVASQIEVHRRFGGVVPEIASRRHLELLIPVVQEALDRAGVTLPEIDLVAVTAGPGLVGALLVGVSAAKAMAYGLERPLVGVNHLEGHLFANFLEYPDLEYPFLCLIVSGGHTDLLHMKGPGDITVLGRTRDDAAGEAFDKVARVLGLGYPGGPLIDQTARDGDPEAYRFPRAYLEEGSWDFSFSGLKTAVANFVAKAQAGTGVAGVAGRFGARPVAGVEGGQAPPRLADIAASFQRAVAQVLVDKTVRAATALGLDRVAVAGGVAANSELRRLMEERASAAGLEVFFPRPSLCTDNAAMIAHAGLVRYLLQGPAPLDLNAVADLPF